MVKEKTRPENNENEDLGVIRDLILYNDDFNTFDFVIRTLIEICEHEPHQAEQCSLIVHYKGKCAVKSGTYDQLKPKFDALINKGLSATID